MGLLNKDMIMSNLKRNKFGSDNNRNVPDKPEVEQLSETAGTETGRQLRVIEENI